MADDDVEELQESLSKFCTEKPNTHLILVAAQKCVSGGKWTRLLECLTRSDHKDALEFVGWELIGVISQAIADDFESDALEERKKILRLIAERCSAKEVCIGVLEQLDSGTDCHFNNFVTLLDTLKTAIHRLQEKKSKYVGMALPCVTRYIKGIQLSDEIETEKESGSECLKMPSIMKHVLDFLRPLVQEVSLQSSSAEISPSSSCISQLGPEIIKCLIQLLDYPLVFVDLEKHSKENADPDNEDDESISEEKCSLTVMEYRTIALEIMKFIHMANGSYLYLMEYTSKTYNNVQEKSNKTSDRDVSAEEEYDDEDEQERSCYPVLGLGCFVYLLLVEKMEDRNIPAVFSFRYLLRVNIKSILFLLSRTEHGVIYKGLGLLETLSKRLKDKSLVYNQYEFKDLMDIVKALINVMTMCSSKKLRLRAVQVLPNLVSKLDTRSRYGLLYTVLQDCSHPGVAGLLIHLLKEQVDQALSTSEDEPWFQGSRLMSILQLVFKPPSGAGTDKDLVQETDRVMAALNCLRFVLLRDESDKTTVWRNFTTIEKDFTEPLRQASKVTRLQYQAELANKRDEMAGNKSKNMEQNTEFSVKSPDGKALELMSLADQCEALQSGLYSLDMMDSVLARITEIATIRSKGGK
ncbi:glomulin [Pocillopora verrucosa]|uniref:glomulin n=1 Tax=Pocillopora verrucosa TaxID=203993 RepID=UPI00333FBA21